MPFPLRAAARTSIILAFGVLAALWSASSASAAQTAGIQTHLLWSDVDEAEMRRQLDLVQESGAGMTRVDVGWATLQQSSRDRYEGWFLTRLDRLVEEASKRRIKLLLTFMNSPCWASSAPASAKQDCAGSWWSRGVTTYTPTDPDDYARALAYLVGRYQGRVAAWEIWNEPNSSSYYKAPDRAVAYAALVKASYAAAKRADPDATIIAGSLSQADYAFTQRLYDLGVKGSFDAFSIHPYNDDVSPLDSRTGVDARYSFLRGVPKVRETMLANGDDKPLWLTESGWSTSTLRGAEPWRNGVTEEQQARFVREQAEQVARWSYVPVTIWFKLRDVGSDRADKYSNCGLRRVDGSPKPAWATFRVAAEALQQSDPGDEAPPAGEAPVAESPQGGGGTWPAGGVGPVVPGPVAGVPTAPVSTAPQPAGTPAAGSARRERSGRPRHRHAARRRAAARRAVARRAAVRRRAAKQRRLRLSARTPAARRA